MRTLALFATVGIIGCAAPIPAPPIVRTVEVKIPVMVACKTTMPPLPLWALSRISPDASLFDPVRAAMIEGKQRQAYEALLTAALLACAE